MNVLSTAREGLERAQDKVDRIAKRLAQFAAFEDSAPVDTVDLSEEMVSLVAAQNEYSANVVVARTAAELESKLLDILA